MARVLSRQLSPILVLLTALAAPLRGTEVKILRMHERSDFTGGSFDGVRVGPLGTLELADRFERFAVVEEPLLFAAAAHPDGWIVGTGNSGRVLSVDRRGTVEEMFSAEEPAIYALWVDADGTVFAGTSPDGKVYRIRDGEAEPFFSPQETYIWDLRRAADGRLLVATGIEGKLFAVDEAGDGEIVFDSRDTHIRSLLPLPGGDLVIGTSGQGLIVLLDAGGKAETLYDASAPEVVALAADPGGTLFAALAGSETGGSSPPAVAAPIVPAPGGAGSSIVPDAGSNAGAGQAPALPIPPSPVSLPRARSAGKSQLLRIAEDRTVERVWSSGEDLIHSLCWHRDRLWFGTSDRGRIYSYAVDGEVLEGEVDEGQVVALLAAEDRLVAATSTGSALFRTGGSGERRGTYTSPPLDAELVSRFGSFHWTGGRDAGPPPKFAFRSGNTEEPDATWSAWSEKTEGEKADFQALPAARFIQWRAELRADGGEAPTIDGVEISYRQRNLRPEIESVSVLEPGQILVPINFNPAEQVFEPAHPDRQGIFTTLKPSSSTKSIGGLPKKATKTLWKRGFRTIRWQAEDPNGDDLEYSLSFRRASSGGRWLPVTTAALEEDYYSFDSTVLPDGNYRFRVEASDRQANPPDHGRVAHRVTAAVIVDHSPPRLDSLTETQDGFQAIVRDTWSPLQEVVYSIDGGTWKPAQADDGLVDSREETLVVAAPADAEMLLLRLTDGALNVTTVDLLAAREPDRGRRRARLER